MLYISSKLTSIQLTGVFQLLLFFKSKKIIKKTNPSTSCARIREDIYKHQIYNSSTRNNLQRLTNDQ